MKYPEKPELIPDENKLPDNYDGPCENCGHEPETYHNLSESEQIGKHQDRIDYWCSECEEHQCTKVDYTGPVPVEIGPGIYELQ